MTDGMRTISDAALERMKPKPWSREKIGEVFGWRDTEDGAIETRALYPHRYHGQINHTSDCEYGCGAWAGPSRSGAPDDIDPFGSCPNHPDREHDGPTSNGE